MNAGRKANPAAELLQAAAQGVRNIIVLAEMQELWTDAKHKLIQTVNNCLQCSIHLLMQDPYG